MNLLFNRFFVFFALFVYFPLCSQICTGDIRFESQAQIDAFADGSGGCTVIDGNVKIWEKTAGAITNLQGLSHITTIKGDLLIYQNEKLKNLDHLTTLDTVYGSIQISSNDSLISITGLNDLFFFGPFLTIDGPVTDLALFSHLDSLEYLALSIPLVTELSAFPNLRVVNQFYLLSNKLVDLSGFSSVEKIDELTIIGGESLVTLHGMENIDRLEYLRIHNNQSLTTLSGLDNLELVTGQIIITRNDSLNSLDILLNIESDSLDGITLNENPKLSFCQYEFLCSALARGNFQYSFADNAPGCNNFWEVAKHCQIQCPGNLTFYLQTEIDSFPVRFPDCSFIEGNVYISGVEQLDSLYRLTGIGGNLTISYNKKLKSLSGLHSLEMIGNNLTISSNDSLVSLSGLEGITQLQDLTIFVNKSLTDISGVSNLSEARNIRIENLSAAVSFPALQRVSGNFLIRHVNFSVKNFLFPPLLDTISGVLSLVDINFLTELLGPTTLKHLGGFIIEETDIVTITGFNELRSIDGDISISNNTWLESLAAFQDLSSVGGNVNIASNGLRDLLLFKNLDTIRGGVTLYNNRVLTSLVDLDGIKWIDGSLIIRELPLIDSLTGLDSLSHISGDLEIKYLNAITDLSGLDQLSIIRGSLSIGDNSNLTSYHGLENLDSIYQNADINSISQNGFLGLNSVDYIGGQLTIVNAETIAGLDSLKSVGGLYIRDSPLLEEIEAFTNIREIRGLLKIDAVRRLKRLPDWRHLKEIGGGLHLEEIFDLSNLSGLDSLHTIHGPLTISYIGVNSLAGLENLNTVDGNLVLSVLDYINNIDPLENLRQVNGSIRINHNFYLQNINGLRNVNPDSVYTRSGSEADIRFYANYELSNCSVDFVCEALNSDEKTVEVSFNKKGCDHTFQIEFKCDEPASCQPFNVTLTKQSQIDSFNISNPDCSLIRGDLVIQELSSGLIQNLDSLYRIKTIGKSLKIINNHAITNVDGLLSLRNVGGGIRIQNNSELQDISALSQVDPALFGLLYKENPDVIIGSNPLLDYCSIDMACKLFTIPGKSYSFFGNGELCTSNALVKEQCIYPKECALNGKVATQEAVEIFPIMYPGCEVLNSDLIVDPITSLQVYNLKGFQKLKQINGDLVIMNSRGLSDLKGLDSLEIVNGRITIRNNKKLFSLESLSGINKDSLTVLGFQSKIEITGNDSLTICAIEPVCAALTDPDDIVLISDNYTNCNTKDEVLSACIVSTTHPSNEIDLSIYPNPTSGELNFEFDQDHKIEIRTVSVYDYMGYMVGSEKFNSTLSLAHLSNGLYTLIFTTSGYQVFSARVVLLK